MSREDAQAQIEALGGKVTGSVSKKTSYLVVGAEPGQQDSRKRARLASTTLDEPAFLEAYNERSHDAAVRVAHRRH